MKVNNYTVTHTVGVALRWNEHLSLVGKKDMGIIVAALYWKH